MALPSVSEIPSTISAFFPKVPRIPLAMAEPYGEFKIRPRYVSNQLKRGKRELIVVIMSTRGAAAEYSDVATEYTDVAAEYTDTAAEYTDAATEYTDAAAEY